jgi:hypothetical protein
MTEAFFVRDGEWLAATPLTRGPWSERAQHGGPPAALLARAIAAAGDDAQYWVVARLTFELLRPVPIARVRTTCEPIKLGRKVQWHSARLVAEDGSELVRATGLRVRRNAVELPPPAVSRAPALPHPDTLVPFVFPFFGTAVGYHTAVDLRIARGVWGRGPAAAWIRAKVPLVLGTPTSPLERVVVAADATNGVCPVLDVRRFTFVNPDLTVCFSREPVGEWVGLDARSHADGVGIGMAQAEIHDLSGELGRCTQSLVVDARPVDPRPGPG